MECTFSFMINEDDIFNVIAQMTKSTHLKHFNLDQSQLYNMDDGGDTVLSFTFTQNDNGVLYLEIINDVNHECCVVIQTDELFNTATELHRLLKPVSTFKEDEDE